MAELTLDIFDVGQGDGMFVNFPNGKTMMIDFGSTKNRGLIREDIFKYFTDHTQYGRGPGQPLDYLVLTHGDSDHYNQIVRFVEKFEPKISNIVHGGHADEYAGKDGKNLVQWLVERMRAKYGITVAVVAGWQPKFPMGLGPKEDSVREFGAEVLVLCSGLEVSSGDEGYVKNSRSTVIQICYPPNRGRDEQNVLMLTGDATRDVEEYVLRRYGDGKSGLTTALLRSDVLKLAHHGSHRTSNCVRWLTAVNPRYAFVSSDRHGALDEYEKSGHRLPQDLTLELVKTCCPRLVDDAPVHQYVSAFDPADVAEYNAKPDPGGKLLAVPTGTSEWRQHSDQLGIFSTLVSIGPGNVDADQGVQYRVVLGNDGRLDVLATVDFATFNPVNGQYRDDDRMEMDGQ